DQLGARLLKAVRRNAIDVAEEREALDDGKIPPELRSLAEHRSDPRHVSHAVAPRHQPIDDAMAARRLEDATEDLDRGRLARAVRPDQADELTFSETERDLVDRGDTPISPAQQSTERAPRTRPALGDTERLR